VQLFPRVGQRRQRVDAQQQRPRFLLILVGILRLAVVSPLHFQVCVRGTIRRPCHNTALGSPDPAATKKLTFFVEPTKLVLTNPRGSMLTWNNEIE
jgi:hypothetical protein